VVINPDKLKRLADKAGVSRDELAHAVEATGMGHRDAHSAVNNWLAGRNHPRLKVRHVQAIAQAIGAEPSQFVRFTSQADFVRGSARKARLVADMIRGMPVERALSVLQFSPKRAAVDVRKTLSAAIADAEQGNADLGALIVAESRIDGGPTIKRFHPKDRGRAHTIRKRMSHIVVGVEER
jgi:large subunit ribosomal protein L22